MRTNAFDPLLYRSCCSLAAACRHRSKAWVRHVPYLESLVSSRVDIDEIVDLLDGVLQLQIGVVWGQLQLSDEPINLGDEQDDGKALSKGLANHSLSDQHAALYCIHTKQHAIDCSEGRAHFILEVDMTCSVIIFISSSNVQLLPMKLTDRFDLGNESW